MNQNACFLPDTTPSTAMPDSLLPNGSSSGIVNGTPSSDQFIYAGKVIHGLPSSMDASSSLLAAHNSTAGRFNGDNGTTIKTEASYSGNSDFGFCNESAFLEPCQSIGDASGGSFSSSELNGQPLGDPIMDMDSSSFGFLSQIPRNFSFSDLTEDFSQSAGIIFCDITFFFFSFPFLQHCCLLCNVYIHLLFWIVCRNIGELWQIPFYPF